MMPLLQPRRDDADHARMPARRADDDGRIALRIEPLRELRLGLLQHVILDGAPLAILRVEIGGERARARGVFGEQQFQRILRGAEPAGGVQARAEPEADIRRTEAAARSPLTSISARRPTHFVRSSCARPRFTSTRFSSRAARDRPRCRARRDRDIRADRSPRPAGA